MEMGRALNEGTLSVWPDEDTRQFYESRMELRHMVPAILFQVRLHHPSFRAVLKSQIHVVISFLNHLKMQFHSVLKMLAQCMCRNFRRVIVLA